MQDIVIRSGTIVDGTGRAPFQADVAIDRNRITQVGAVSARGREEIDARGKIVTPGFVDIHTHYDGQATWDSWLAPSSLHGVTSIVMGNCGVGFAPVKPDKHDWLINLMEGVEDIPGSALAEGLTWDWETFPEYLDALDRRQYVMDIGTHVPHGALRSYVMGERALSPDAAVTSEEIEAMVKLTEEGLRAGALGFSTSRTANQRARTGELTPSIWADEIELRAIFETVARSGANSVFEVTSDYAGDEAVDLFTKLSRETGVRVSFSLVQHHYDAEEWRMLLRHMEQGRAEGANISAQFCARFIGMLFNWRASLHPFMYKPSWMKIKALPWKEQLERLRDPVFRRQVIEEDSEFPENNFIANAQSILQAFDKMYAVEGDTINYEPAPEESLAAREKRENRTAAELAYDAMMADDGNGFVILALMNYANGNYDHVYDMIGRDFSISGLSDGGAHVGTICDASIPTYFLTHWARDRKRGPRIPLEQVIHHQTSRTASFYGLHDRGVVAPGYLADINVIDFDGLRLEKPYLAFDLPAGGKRFLQRAKGYTATIKSGVVVSRNGEFTGELPGRLVRGSLCATGLAGPAFRHRAAARIGRLPRRDRR